MNWFARQKTGLQGRCREQTYGHKGGKVGVWWWWDELGDWD